MLHCSKIAPTANYDASQITRDLHSGSNNFKHGASTKAFLSALKATVHFSVHSNVFSFLVRSVKGYAILANCLTNLL